MLATSHVSKITSVIKLHHKDSSIKIFTLFLGNLQLEILYLKYLFYFGPQKVLVCHALSVFRNNLQNLGRQYRDQKLTNFSST